jgi:membrane protein
LNFDLRGLVRDLGATVPRFRRHNGLHLCAGVSFYALLSLAPLLYLAAALVGRILRDDHVTTRVLGVLEPLFPDTAGESLREVTQSLQTDDPLVLLALPALFWVASTVLAALELSVNLAFERAHERTVLLSRLKSFALLAVGLLVLLASLVTATSLPGIEQLLWDARVLPQGTRLAGTISRLLIVAMPFLLFATFYKFLPRGRVRWRSAGWGALLALVGWELVRRLFGRVLAHSPALGLLTGTVSGLVTVLLWVYAANVLLLLGAEFAALRHERLERSPNLGEPAT